MAHVKELAFGIFLLLILTQVTWTEDELLLDVKSFNSSTVDFDCRYIGNKTGAFFNVYRESDACIFYKSSCNYYPEKDCKFHCKVSNESNIVSFLVNLNGSCQERVEIRCSVRSTAPGQELELDTFLVLPAQSDTPEIFVENENNLTVGDQPKPVACRVANRCSKTKLEISGIHMSSLDISHRNQENRYNTTARTTAIFNKAGNYTINCREAGNGDDFSYNHTVEVQNITWFEQSGGEPQPLNNESHQIIALAAAIPSFIVLVLLCSLGLLIYKSQKMERVHTYETIPVEDLMAEGVKTDPNSNDRVQNHETVLLRDAKEDGVQTDHNTNDSGYGKKEVEMQTDSGYGKKEEEVQTESGSGKKEQEVQTDSGYGKREEEVQTDNFEDETNDSLLWKCANRFVKAETFHPGAIETLTGLVKVGANPFALYSGKSVFTAFLKESNFHQQESCLPSALKFFEEVLSTEDFSCADEGTLNDVVKSFPRAILESDSNLQRPEEVLVKICFRVIMTNSVLLNHVDNGRRTPLHNLMASLSTDDIWRKAKLLPGSENLLDLMLKLITTKNVKLKDKDKVTPYSWLSWWRESKTFVNVADTPKIKDIIQLLDQTGDKIDHRGQEFLRKVQKKKNIIKLQNSLCGIWIKANERIGEKIANFIETGRNPRKVYEADIENTSYLQECPTYKGYFAVISSQSLMNHNFCVYLMSVLRLFALGTLHNKSAFALVVVDKDAVSLLDDAQNKTIHWPINLHIARVDANSQIDDDLLNEVALKLQGPQLNPGYSTSNGNVGIGLAWGVFQYNFAFMLPGIRKRIETSSANKLYAGKMSKHYIIIIPESSEIDLKIQEHGIPSANIIGHLDNANRIERAGWSPYRLKELVFEITNTQGEKFYSCAKYIRHHDALKYMLEIGELAEEDIEKQHRLFTDTMKSIISDPLSQNHALVFCCQDYNSLPDKLCELITKPVVEQPLSFETNPWNQVTWVAEGLAWSYFRRYVGDLGPGLVKAIKETEQYKSKKMPAKYFILLPYSCVIHYKVNDADKEHIKKSDKKLKGHEKVIPIYEISSPRSSAQESYFACVAYRVEAGLLREMETGKLSALTPVQRAAELRIFYEVLNYLFTRPSAPECCGIVRLIYYDDDENCGRKLSEILMEEIKESLQEEGAT